MDAEVKKYLDRMDRRWSEKFNSLLNTLTVKSEAGTWLTANQLNKQFGITHRELFKLRRNQQVEKKSTGKRSWLYKLESIPGHFVKSK